MALPTQGKWRLGSYQSTSATIISEESNDFAITIKTGNGDGWGSRDFTRESEHLTNIRLVESSKELYELMKEMLSDPHSDFRKSLSNRAQKIVDFIEYI